MRTQGRRRRGAVTWGVVACVAVATVACAEEASPEDVGRALSSSGGADDAGGPVVLEDHWHAAYGVYVCDRFLPPEPQFETAEGIHTHGEGVIHVHPFAEAAAGAGATFDLFLRGSEVDVDGGVLTVGDERYGEGVGGDGESCDGEAADVRVAYWPDATATADPPEVVGEDAGDLRFRGDGEAYTIAFVPEGADIPPPPTVDRLAELSAADGSTGTPGPGTSDPGAADPGYTDPALAQEVLGRTPPEPDPPPEDTPADAAEAEAVIEGRGDGAVAGDMLTAHYVGVLADGTVFDESWSRGEPITIRIGVGEVIPGWDEGLVGARPGDRVRLVMGADKAYGAEGSADGTIPPDAALAFEVDVVDVAR
jgi:peptidylprolyl isomerase